MEIKRAVWILALPLILATIIRAENVQEEVNNSIAAWHDILCAVYDGDSSLVPDEPNEILALEGSPDKRDQLAWAIFNIIRHEMDPNTPMEEKFHEVSLPQEISSATESISEPQASSIADANSPDHQLGMLLSEPIQDLSGPLGSRILSPGTYRIGSLPLLIEGHVIICAGTKLIAPYDPNHNIIEVVPGGWLETGKAAFYSQEDYPDVLPAVEIVSEDPNKTFCHNHTGIYIHRGANRRTQLENIIIENCTIGIVLDESLDYSIRNVITVGCYDGIQLYAPVGITDCQFWFNGSYSYGVFSYPGTGIYVSLDWPGDPNIIIDRTTLYSADAALYVEGGNADPNVTEPNQAVPYVNVINSCLCGGYYYGLYQSPGEAVIDLQYCGFGGNESITNVSLPLTECVQLTFNPFYTTEEDLERLYVSPYSELIDAGEGMAIDGMGVCHDRPDTGRMDIGAHFPLGVTGGFGIQSSPADFNWDGVVDEADLALMNACMGASNDPNLVRMDFDYGSRIDLPDFAWFAFDYGYCGDPNICSNHDPNSARSDFDGDDRVDLADLAVLAEHWLVPVFDEYRLCRQCNLHTGVDSNVPNGPSGIGVIDYRDMDVFMADWGKVYHTGCSVIYKNEQDDSVEPNHLSGVVEISLTDYPSSTWIFLQVDGGQAYETYADSRLPTFVIPTYEFANGQHVLTIGGHMPENGCWIQKFPVAFDNKLYLASIPDMYEPNMPYEITGFFDANGTATISTEPNVNTVSNSGYIEHTSILSKPSAKATISYENGSFTQTQTLALLAAIDLSKKDPNSWRAVIIAPNKKINNAAEDEHLPDNRLLTAIRETLEAANIPYEELIEKNANWDNIKRALTGPNLNYVYWIGHMNSFVGIGEDAVQRTHFTCWNRRQFRFDEEAHILSWVKSDRPDVPAYISIPDLPGDWDTRGFSMTSLKLWQTKKIKEFWAIGCQSAVKWETADLNDMALAVGAYNYKDTAGHYTHIYIGNKIDVIPGGACNFLIGYPSALSKIIRRHKTTHLGNALLTNDLEPYELYALWGNDRDRDGAADNTLQWWPSDIEFFRVIFQ